MMTCRKQPHACAWACLSRGTCAGALACLPVVGPLYMAWAGLQVAAGVADLIGTGLEVRRQLALTCIVFGHLGAGCLPACQSIAAVAPDEML